MGPTHRGRVQAVVWVSPFSSVSILRLLTPKGCNDWFTGWVDRWPDPFTHCIKIRIVECIDVGIGVYRMHVGRGFGGSVLAWPMSRTQRSVRHERGVLGTACAAFSQCEQVWGEHSSSGCRLKPRPGNTHHEVNYHIWATSPTCMCVGCVTYAANRTHLHMQTSAHTPVLYYNLFMYKPYMFY